MRDIQKEIQDNLNEIEKKYKVKILLAVESGSRAWGFASPDSDYDVRFIYMHEPKEYLRIDRMRDVIEWKLDEILDINGWDLKKALQAFAKGNPNILEWASSPIVYRKAEEWNDILPSAFYFFSEKTALCHYYGTARSTLEEFLKGEQVKYKKYFYALRPLLCCKWIEIYHCAPPVLFNDLMILFENPLAALGPELKFEIENLLKKKAVTLETDLNPQVPEIISFIREECDRQKYLSENAPDDHKKNYKLLNDVFRRTLGYQ